MTEYQVPRWRELPSMVAARTDDETVKSQLDAAWPVDRIAGSFERLHA